MDTALRRRRKMLLDGAVTTTHTRSRRTAPVPSGDEDVMGLRHEGPEQFSQTPLWVIMTCRKDVWLYDFLRARYGGLNATFPGIPRIAEELGISRSTVKRALEGLATGGAIEIRTRYLPNGAQTSNEYVTLWRRPRTGR